MWPQLGTSSHHQLLISVLLLDSNSLWTMLISAFSLVFNRLLVLQCCCSHCSYLFYCLTMRSSNKTWRDLGTMSDNGATSIAIQRVLNTNETDLSPSPFQQYSRWLQVERTRWGAWQRQRQELESYVIDVTSPALKHDHWRAGPRRPRQNYDITVQSLESEVSVTTLVIATDSLASDS